MREYKPKDFPIIKRWYEYYGTHLGDNLLPDIGFISDHAACFLMTTNSGFCFLEPLIGDPHEPEERRAELDSVIEACVQKAKELGFTQVLGLAKTESVIERARKLGFTELSTYTMLSRRI